MSVQITENIGGTIKGFIQFSGMNIDEVQICAEIHSPVSCEITRVFIDIDKDYGEQNLDMGRLNAKLSKWEDEIIEALENGK